MLTPIFIVDADDYAHDGAMACKLDAHFTGLYRDYRATAIIAARWAYATGIYFQRTMSQFLAFDFASHWVDTKRGFRRLFFILIAF